MSIYQQFCGKLIAEFRDSRNIGILGFGREGRSTYQLLRTLLPQQKLIIADKNPQALFNILNEDNIHCVSGDHYINIFFELVDVAFISPGIPLFGVSVPQEVVITSQTDLMFQYLGDKIIAVTGTKGKSTTVSLITHILKHLTSDVVCAGNLGVPAFDIIQPDRDYEYIVLEVSSHQLQFIRSSPRISVILNLFPEHLDYYPDIHSYYNAKMNLISRSKNIVFLNLDNDNLMQLSNNLHAKSYFFSVLQKPPKGLWIEGDEVWLTDEMHTEKLLDLPKMQLIGQHNISNVLAALGVCYILNVQPAMMCSALQTFSPLAHRMQPFKSYNGCLCYDDSIATIPQATLAAVETLQPVHTIIVGGFNRGLHYLDFAEALLRFDVKVISCYGDAGKEMYRIFQQLDGKREVRYFQNFEDAVRWALERTPENEKCLLSPAAASYDQFRNFEERGLAFQRIARTFQ